MRSDRMKPESINSDDRFFAMLAKAKGRIAHGGLERAAQRCGIKRPNQWAESSLRKPGTSGRFSPQALEALSDEASFSDDERVEFFFAWMLWRLDSSPLAPALRIVFDELRASLSEAKYRDCLSRAYASMQTTTAS